MPFRIWRWVFGAEDRFASAEFGLRWGFGGFEDSTEDGPAFVACVVPPKPRKPMEFGVY